MIYRRVYLLLPRVVDHDWGGGVGAGLPGILAVGGDRTYLVIFEFHGENDELKHVLIRNKTVFKKKHDKLYISRQNGNVIARK
jgi:hypothetical protein